MFVPVKKQASNKTVRLPDTLIEQIESLGAQKDVSFNQIVVQCCEYAVAHVSGNAKTSGCG